MFLFQITDHSIDGSGGTVELTDGGVDHKFVELRFNSQLGKGLDYMILAYTNTQTSGNNATVTSL